MSKTEDKFNPEEQVKEIRKIIDNPDEFSNLFCVALSKQVEMREKVKSIVLELIKTNTNGRNEIKALINEVNKEDWRQFLKSTWGKFAFLAWTILVAVISVLIKSFFEKP